MAKNKTKITPNPDVKKHPVAMEEDKNIDLASRKLKDFISLIEKQTNNDITNTKAHHDRLAHWYNRRHGTLNQNPSYPWVGSSNINMPLMDTEITKAKAPEMQVFDVMPIVSFEAISTEAFDKTDAAENTMQHLLTTSMRDFKKNMEIGIDNKLQNGYAWVKTVYEFRTDIVTETIRKEELLQKDLEDIAILKASIEEGQPMPLPNGEQVIPTQDDLDILMSNMISVRFGLNKEDKIDQDAITDIMRFIIKGDDAVTIKRNFIVRNAPYASIVDPSRLFPEEGIMDIQDAERITELFVETENDMKHKVRTGWYNASAVDDILKGREVDDSEEDRGGKPANDVFSQLDNDKRNREGLTTSSRKGVVENKEVYCMYDLNDDGIDERCLLIYNPESLKVLRFMEFPYEHGEWPYVQLRNEETDGRLYSPRGIPEIIDPLDDMITQNHRSKLNAMQIGNSPTFKYRLGSQINPGNWNWVPGQMMPVMSMDDIEQVQINVKDYSFDNEENNLKFWIESLIGSFDATFREEKSESRTATGVQAIVGLQQSSQSLKISRLQDQMKKVYNQIWSLHMQYGPSEIDLKTSNGELRKISKHEIKGKFNLVPSGTTANTNPQLELSKAQQRINLIMGMMENFGGPQGVAQVVGDEYEMNFGLALKDLFNKDDFVSSNSIMRKRSDQELQQIQQQRQAAAQQAQQQQAQEQAVQANRPLPIGEAQSMLKNIAKESPNGDGQRLSL